MKIRYLAIAITLAVIAACNSKPPPQPGQENASYDSAMPQASPGDTDVPPPSVKKGPKKPGIR